MNHKKRLPRKARAHFLLYKPVLEYWRKLAPRDLRLAVTIESIAFTHARLSGAPSMVEWHHIADERWKEEGSKTVFLENRDLVRLLMNATIDVDPSSFLVPWNGFAICFPRDGLEDTGIRPFLFQRWKDIDEQGRRITDLYKRSGVIATTRRSPNAPREGLIGIYHSGGGCNYVDEIALSKVPMCLRPGGLKQHIDSKDYRSSCNSFELSEREMEIERVLFQLALAICLYIKAFPQCLRPGFPRNIELLREDASCVSPFRLGFPPGTHASPEMHLRRAHFRTLWHERFKHDPDGSPRVVFVHPCVVSGEIDPHTLERAPRDRADSLPLEFAET